MVNELSLYMSVFIYVEGYFALLFLIVESNSRVFANRLPSMICVQALYLWTQPKSLWLGNFDSSSGFTSDSWVEPLRLSFQEEVWPSACMSVCCFAHPYTGLSLPVSVRLSVRLFVLFSSSIWLSVSDVSFRSFTILFAIKSTRRALGQWVIT